MIKKDKGTLVFWDKKRGRNFLQNSAPAYWERFEKIISTSLHTIQSENDTESQVKKSEGELQHVDARFLIEQDPDKHPIAYASIQMAKYMLYGKGEGFLRNVPSRLIEKLLPSERYSPFQ